MNELLSVLNRLHTTEMGEARIRTNLQLGDQDPVKHCREVIAAQDTEITRRGKNWYCENAREIITVNAASLTIITAHLK